MERNRWVDKDQKFSRSFSPASSQDMQRKRSANRKCKHVQREKGKHDGDNTDTKRKCECFLIVVSLVLKIQPKSLCLYSLTKNTA